MRIAKAFALLLAAASLRAEKVVVTVLATTDLHGRLYPIDYGDDRPVDRGLAKMATLIRAARAENPNSVLVDCGDAIQGTPLEYVYETLVRTGRAPLGITLPAPLAHDPMMLAMNRIGYDAMTVGNHEYNFGLQVLERARADARFPWLSANTVVTSGGKEKPYASYIVKTVAGVKVAIIGITTPAVPTWEKPENYGSYRFEAAPAAVKKTLGELRAREHPDLVLVAAHSGLGRDLETGQLRDADENVVYDVAMQVPDLDAIVFGHSHQELAGRMIGNVLVVQPKNWAISLGRIDFTLERNVSGPWKMISKTSHVIPVTAQTAPAADILEIAKPYHDAAERYLNTPVATSSKPLSLELGRIEDTALLDAIQEVERLYAKADVSFASVFNPRVRVPQGAVTVRQIAAVYQYENELYAIEGTGKMVKDALENSARYFLSCQDQRCSQLPLINKDVIGYNYDVAQGVEYEIDLTRPEGDRIRNLSWKGKPLAPGQKLRIAVNNYRAAGSAGYTMFRGAKIVWRSNEEIRDMMVRYYTERKELPATPDGNWKLVPEAARKTLLKEALANAGREEFN